MRGVFTSSNRLSSPVWAQDPIGGREALVPYPAKIDPAQFLGAAGTGVAVTSNGGAAANATALPVDALTVDIPPGTVLYFGGAKKFARLTAWAYIGDTSITVEALPTTIADNDVAYFQRYGSTLFIPSGTVIGRTIVERQADTPFGPAVDTDDEIFLLAFDIPDAFENDDAELYRPGRSVAENRLPEWATLSANAALLAKVRDVYICFQASDGV